MPSRNKDFYPPEFTEHSLSVLNRVREEVPDAILIGGWGTWVRTRGAMSHDIDLIVSRPQLAILGRLADEMSESRHLGGRKWRGTLDGVHLDLYVPHQSRLGRELQLRPERLIDRQDVVDSWVVLDRPGQFATKLAALLDRPDSTPGEKDRHEIMDLLSQGIDSGDAVRAIHYASLRPAAEVTELIGDAFRYLGDLELDRAERRHLNQLGTQWLKHSLQLAHEQSPRLERGLEHGGPSRGL
jgi:hypothetical protein